MKPVAKYVVCPVCEARDALVWRYDNGHGHHVYECTRCEVMALDADRAVVVLEEEHYYDAQMERLYEDNRARLAVTARHYADVLQQLVGDLGGKRILDVGAGLGVFMDEVRARGATVEGLDIRAAATRFLESRGYGAYTRLLPHHARLLPGRYDVVTAWNVIEHDDVPRRFVEAAARLLAPGGWFVLETPDNFHALKRWAYRYLGLVPPRLRVVSTLHTAGGHRFGFSPKSAVALLGAVGLRETGTASVPYDELLTARKMLARPGSLAKRIVTAGALVGGFAAMRTLGIRNRFVAFGRM